MEDGFHSYTCSQFFGCDSYSQQNIDEDNISALKFDPSGAMLALGDRSGRLIVFRAGQKADDQEYEYNFQFQSHEGEFDTLRSVRLGEQIGHINWLRPQSKYLKLLTSNSNTIKMWKIFQKQPKSLSRTAGSQLSIPHLYPQEPFVSVNLKQIYPNQACRSLNSLTLSGNEEYMLATDEVNAFLWSIEQASHPFIVKSLCKSQNGVDRKERITCSHLNPQSESLFVYGTSRGEVHFNDCRASLRHADTLTFSAPPVQNNFLSDIISKYCSVMFLQGTSKIVARDLISVKVWDMCNPKQPLLSTPIDEAIHSRLCDLFEADALDDRFALSNAKGSIITGNYGNSLHLIDSLSGSNHQYEMDYTKDTHCRLVGSSKSQRNLFNCQQKVVCHDFNPITGQMAASTSNCFYIYSKTSKEAS